LEQDVVYIITKDERVRFLALASDDARDKFIKDFWEVRNPVPGAEINTYKEEIYQRIAFANSRFGIGSGSEGWRTDRGRTYITLGAPQQKDVHRGAATYAPSKFGSTQTSPPSFRNPFTSCFMTRWRKRLQILQPYLDGPDKLTTGVEAINNPPPGSR